MKKLILFFFISICSFQPKAQTTIQVNKGDIKINGVAIKPTSTLNDIKNLLGEPDRIVLTKVTTYYYDNLGIFIGSGINSNYLSSITTLLNSNTTGSALEGLPTTGHSFKGSLIIGGYTLTKYSSLNSLKQIEDLFIGKDNLNALGIYIAAIGINKVWIFYSRENLDDLLQVQIPIEY